MTNKEEAKVLRVCADKLGSLQRCSEQVTILRDKADLLDPPCLNAIPEGELCWGRDESAHCWVPCVATGEGWATDMRGDRYSVIRLVKSAQWPDKGLRYFVLWQNGVRDFWAEDSFKECDGSVYYEEKPDGSN